LTHVGAWAPMAEQKAVANYLLQTDHIKTYLRHFKNELEFRLKNIFYGIQALKDKGYNVDAVTPQAAIYLTIKFDLTGKKQPDGTVIESQTDVTTYLLNEAKLAVVPFYAFGASKSSPWYRLSVGTCKKEEINLMLQGLESALAKLV
jgi:aspartate aminotransferase